MSHPARVYPVRFIGERYCLFFMPGDRPNAVMEECV